MGKKSSIDLLEALAPFYESIWAPIGMLISARRRYSSILKEAAKFLRCDSVLDIGAGTGKLSDYINSSYYALDLSEKFLKILKKKRKNKDIVRADALFLPFKKECFDGIAMMFLIHLIDDKYRFMSNVRSLLKKDGKLVFTALCKGSKIGDLLSRWWKVQALGEKEYLDLLESLDFKIVESKRIGAWIFVKCRI